MIYVLVDKSGSYAKFTQAAVNMIISGLAESLVPGDRIYLGWIGDNKEPDKYLYSGDVPGFQSDLILSPLPGTLTPLPTRTIPPTATITLTPNPTVGVLQDQVRQPTLDAEATALSLTATQQAVEIDEIYKKEEDIHAAMDNLQTCAYHAINTENLQAIESRRKQMEEIRNSFIISTLSPLLTPSVDAGDKSTHIYDAIYVASRVLQGEIAGGKYRSVNLVILSDMMDQGSRQGEDLRIDLAGVRVLIAMVYCEDSIDCQKREDFWSEFMATNGAMFIPTSFKIIQETTPGLIVDFLNEP